MTGRFICVDQEKVSKGFLLFQVHYRTHTDEKPITCNLCDFACRQRASLQWHMKKRHPSAVGIAPGNEPSGMEELGTL